MSVALSLIDVAGVHEGVGTSRVDGRLLEGQDLGVHGQGRHHAHGCFAIQASAHHGHCALERAMYVSSSPYSYLTLTFVDIDRDIALTLGWIQSVLHQAILQLPESVCSATDKIEAVMAINKVYILPTVSMLRVPDMSQVLWIQNDLFSRHYIGD